MNGAGSLASSAEGLTEGLRQKTGAEVVSLAVILAAVSGKRMARMVGRVSRAAEAVMQAVETTTGTSTITAPTIFGVRASASMAAGPLLACGDGGKGGGGAAIREGSFITRNSVAIRGLRHRTICRPTSLCAVLGLMRPICSGGRRGTSYRVIISICYSAPIFVHRRRGSSCFSRLTPSRAVLKR